MPRTSTPSKAQTVRTLAEEFDRVLDTLGALLRIFGEYAFDTDQTTASEVKETCAAIWRELSLGTSSENADSGQQHRDYSKVQKFLQAQRRQEQEFVHNGVGNLRRAVQEFAQCLSAAVREDRDTDSKLEEQVTRLVEIVDSNNLGAIRVETSKVAGLVRDAIDRRRSREKEQLIHLGTQVQALRRELDAARTQATLDALTQLFNRAAFDQELEKVAALGLLLGSEPCLIMIDVDHFKSINDRHGHPIGDEVLRAIADNLVRHFLRKEDFVCRFGGEEFGVIVRDSTLAKVSTRIERARTTLVQSAVHTSVGEVPATYSAGVAALVPGESPARWLERADRALYDAKHQGRNRTIVWSSALE